MRRTHEQPLPGDVTKSQDHLYKHDLDSYNVDTRPREGLQYTNPTYLPVSAFPIHLCLYFYSILVVVAGSSYYSMQKSNPEYVSGIVWNVPRTIAKPMELCKC